MLCCSRAEHSSTVILKSNMFSMIYNVWSWYDVKMTQNYLLVLFLIIMYSQDYNYTLKYSYGHYMVFVVCVTIFSVLHVLFCLQLSIFWLIITTLCILHLQTWKYQSVDSVSGRLFYCLRTLHISDRHCLDFEIQIKKIVIQYPTEMDFLLTCYIWWVGNIFFCMKLGILLC
jgi:hypothetical protein